jgi:valyl-tRNA synthetase
MPFVTEAIWHEVYGKEKPLMISKWPKPFNEKGLYEKEAGDFQVLVQDTYIFTRSFRTENKVEPAKKLRAQIVSGKFDNILKANLPIILDQARLSSIDFVSKNELDSSLKAVPLTAAVELYIDLGSGVDAGKQKIYLEKELAEAEKYVAVLQNKLANQDFVARAPAAVIDGEHVKLKAAQEKVSKTKTALLSL